jgi:hypothetical protein
MPRYWHILGQTLKFLLLALVLFYLADWGTFAVRLKRGTGLKNVTVEQYLSTPLKGQKIEYDYLGTAERSCSRAVFPQYVASQWIPPCWWLQRHNQAWQ